MSKVVVAMSMSLDGIAGPESADADGMAIFVPKLIGRGVRLFDHTEVDLRCIETIPGEGAVHLRYEVT
jgi:hypothetical protein